MRHSRLGRGRALEAGINLFDTADVYGWKMGRGITEQSLHNLSTRHVEMEVLPACRAYGLGFLPYSPLAGGLLAGIAKTPRSSKRFGEIEDRIENHRAAIESYEALCRELNEKPAVVALSWLLHQPGVTAPIVGPRTLGQLEDSLRALEVELGGEILERLDSIWPGPGEAAGSAEINAVDASSSIHSDYLPGYEIEP